MKDTRLEILKNGEWVSLRLRDSSAIRYNALINRIGSISSREISHSNTFSLPPVFQNTQALGLNVFNKSVMAQAFNRKFEAKYYVQDKLLQVGFLFLKFLL